MRYIIAVTVIAESRYVGYLLNTIANGEKLRVAPSTGE